MVPTNPLSYVWSGLLAFFLGPLLFVLWMAFAEGAGGSTALPTFGLIAMMILGLRWVGVGVFHLASGRRTLRCRDRDKRWASRARAYLAESG